MDIRALKEKDFQAWVPFMDAEVLIRFVAADELQRISGELAWPRGTRRIDGDEAKKLLGRAAVRDWKGITLEGTEFPYSEENCDFLMTRWSEFSRFVSDSCVNVALLGNRERADG